VTAHRVIDHAAHLQAADLPGQDAVLDHRDGAAGFDRRDEGEVLRRGLRRRLEGFGRGGDQLPLHGSPHGDREGELLGPTGEQSGVAIGHELQAARPLPPRPRQCGAESSAGVVLDQHPRDVVVDQRRARRVRRQVARDGATQVVADEGAQLDAAEARPSVGLAGVDDGYFLAPALRVP
jgi:hypothetical protein